MVTNFASKLMKKILSEKDLEAKGRRGGDEEGRRWEGEVGMGENEMVGRGDGGRVRGCINIRKGK